jgi:hypothetical protein
MSLLITLGLGASQIPSSGSTPAINPTQYMYLTLPTVSVTAGPLYAQDVNASFLLVDQHDHTPGKGKQVPVAGMNFNGNLLLNGFQVNNIDQLAFVIRSATVAGSVGTLYASGQDLYFIDGTGAIIQITAGHSVNVTGTGGWTGNYGTGGSTASYTTIGTVFALFSVSGQYGKLATGDLQLYKANTASAAPVTILSPLTTTGAYSLTLPSTPSVDTLTRPVMAINDGAGNTTLKYNTPSANVWPPGIPRLLTADTQGNISANVIPDGSTIVVPAGLGAASPTIQVGVVQTVNIADQSVTVPKLGPALVQVSAAFNTSYASPFSAIVATVNYVPSSKSSSGGGPAARAVRISVQPDYLLSTYSFVSQSASAAMDCRFYLGYSPTPGGLTGGQPVVQYKNNWGSAVTMPINLIFGDVVIPAGIFTAGVSYAITLNVLSNAGSTGTLFVTGRFVAQEL